MDAETIIAVTSIVVAGLTMAVGAVGAALGESRVGAAAMDALARQPDEAPTITRTLFVGLAMVESTAIFCLVIALILLFANPFTSSPASPQPPEPVPATRPETAAPATSHLETGHVPDRSL